MSSLYFLIPMAVIILAAGIWAFVWSVKSGQFEDMDGPAHRILMDDDDPNIPEDARVVKRPQNPSSSD